MKQWLRAMYWGSSEGYDNAFCALQVLQGKSNVLNGKFNEHCYQHSSGIIKSTSKGKRRTHITQHMPPCVHQNLYWGFFGRFGHSKAYLLAAPAPSDCKFHI